LHENSKPAMDALVSRGGDTAMGVPGKLTSTLLPPEPQFKTVAEIGP
jgi:hypothetical protein